MTDNFFLRSTYLVIAMNGGEEAGDEVTVQILVVAHLVHALSFIPSHLGLMFVPGPSLSKS